MNFALLLTRPNYDVGTNYLYYWSEAAVNPSFGFKILDLKGSKANQSNFISYVTKHQPSIVFFNGHGSEDVIAGHDNETLLESGENEHLLNGRIIYARCCDAAKRLGLNCVKSGALAFIGYNRKFILGYNDSYIARPLLDPVAKLFLGPSNLIPRSLLKRNTVCMALKKSKEAMLKNMRFMVSSSSSMEQRDAAPYLWANINSQVVIGDSEASA